MTSFPLATIGDYLQAGWELSPFWVLWISAVIHVSFVMLVFGLVPVVWIWGERKIAGRIQDRLGPTRVGGKFGWLQSFADGIKLIQKEDLIPSAADSMLFRMAPYMVCVATLASFVVLPFADGWVAVTSDIALLVLVAILSLEVIGVIFAGYSSGSKWSLFGGMREAAQVVSYEIPLSICAIIPVTVAGTLNLSEISQLQSGWFGNWLVFHSPFTLMAFFAYFTVATASCKRAPFDLAEAESELVGGFHTEYSGMRWSFFFLGEYAAMFVVCAVAAILFLGGWNTGIGPLDEFLIGLRQSSAGQTGFVPASYLANVLGMVVVVSKGFLLVFVQVWIRWTLPRLRIDQVMVTCLKYLIPISCVLFLSTIAWPLAVYKITAKTETVMQDGEPVRDERGKRVKVVTESRTSLWSPTADRLPRQQPRPAESPTSSVAPQRSSSAASHHDRERVVAGGRE
jgi:NADH-quinone oxidoreductase subunit H